MKIERIGENKIRVLVNDEDIRLWRVNLKNFTENTPEAQNMFWHALKQAEEDVNFMVGQAQLLVETVPTEGLGYALIISRLESEEAMAEALSRAGKRVRQTEFRVRRKTKAMPLLRMYKFDDFEEVCRGVAEICEEYIGTSRLIKYQSRMYLELLPSDNFRLFEMENILSEFAEKVKNPLVMQGVLNEHGIVMLAEDAVGIISRNFK